MIEKKHISLVKLLISLGAHLGHKASDSVSLSHKYVIGIYKNRYILNVNYIVFFLNKALLFVKHTGNQNKRMLFHINSLFLHDIEVRHSFLHFIHTQNNHSYLDEYWYPSQMKDLLNSFFVLKDLFIKMKKQKNLNLKWFDLLTRLFEHTYQNRITGIPFFSYLKKMIKFWRFFYFFKFYFSYKRLPDIFCYFNVLELQYPIMEVLLLKVPVISTCDTNMKITGITYPLLLNDKSLLLNFFLVKLLINAYNIGKKKA